MYLILFTYNDSQEVQEQVTSYECNENFSK